MASSDLTHGVSGQWINPPGSTTHEEPTLTDLPPREVDRLENAIRDLTGALERHRDTIDATFVRKDVLEPRLEAMNKTIEGHSEAFTWIVRIVVGAVVLALLGLVIANTGGAP